MSEIRKTHNLKNEWETPEIDLNLRHYSGNVSDVFRKIKHDIVKYLMKPETTTYSKQIYSAIYNALDYYEILSPEFAFDTSFLSSSIKNFNDDYQYLSEKYDSESLFDLPVITLNARIKSPLSFVEKVKDKINEYIEENRNFIYFNESLRDILGVRIIVSPPKNVKDLGLQEESNYLYKIFYDLMCHKGILNPNETNFKFLDVNTRYDKTKLEKIKANKFDGEFLTTSMTPTLKEQQDLENYKCIIIPETRPSYMEEIDSKVKDYHLYPKKSGYQSLHLCVIPEFSKYVIKPKLPNCIIPPASTDYSIEYQFRTTREDGFSNLGPASHEKLKPFEKIYHRLAVPSFIDSDDSKHSDLSTPNSIFRKFLKPRNFGENYQRFYGPSFEERFNISYNMFNYAFDKSTQDDILAGKKIVYFDEKTNTYHSTNSDIPIGVEVSDQISTNFTLSNFLEDSHLSDSILSTSNKEQNISENSNLHIKLYKLISLQKIQKKAHRKTPIVKKITKNIKNESNAHEEH